MFNLGEKIEKKQIEVDQVRKGNVIHDGNGKRTIHFS